METQKYVDEKIEKVQQIIDALLKKIKIVLGFPFLLKMKKLKRILTPNEMYMFNEILHYYCKKSSNNENDDLDNFDIAYKLSHLLQFFSENPEICQLNNEYLSKIESTNEFIKIIDLYKNFIDEEMKVSPKMKLTRDVKLQNSKMNLKDIETEMNFLKNQLENQQKQCNKCIEALKEEIERCEMQIREMGVEHENSISEIIQSSEKEMIYVSKYMDMQKNDLEDKMKIEDKKYQKSEAEISKRENELQKLRLQAEKKHLESISFYDKQIGNKHELKENLQTELMTLKDECNVVQNKLNRQENLYLQLKEERELIILQIFTERLDHFEKNRAARIIQKTWKDYRERIALKKKRKMRRK